MHLRSIVQRWWTKLVQPRKKASPFSRKTSARLRIEELETRTVMSTTDGSFAAIGLVGPNSLRTDLDPVYNTLSGSGITIANIDTGIYYQNPDLQANVIAYYDAIANSNPYTDGATPLSLAIDPDGHGSHTAGISASSNANIGVAYGSKIVAIRAIPAGNEALPSHDPILTSLQWVYANADTYGIKVVNLSFSVYPSNYTSAPALDNIGMAIRSLEARGIAVVIGSGDNYAAYATPGVTGTSTFGTFTVASTWAKNETLYNTMITAGAYDASYWATETQVAIDQFAAASQRGQLPFQVAAPGQEIYSTWTNTTKGLNGDLLHNLSSGTGIAAPMVSGMIALMQQAAMRFGGRYLTIPEIQGIVLSTADTITDTTTAGNGRVENGQNASSAQNLPETGLTYQRINIFEAVKGVKDLVAPIGLNDLNKQIATAINAGNLNGSVTFKQAGVVGTDGLVQTGATDVDLYKVTLTSPGKLVGNINLGAGTFFPVMRLFNSVGAQIDTNRATSPVSISTGFLTNANLPVGDYYVGISANDNVNYNIVTGTGATLATGTGAYQLSLSLTNEDPNGIITGAFPLAGVTGSITQSIGTDPAPINGSNALLVGPQDVDMYQYIAPDDGNLIVTIDSTTFSNPLDCYFRVFDDQGVQIFQEDGGGLPINTFIVPNLVAGRTYYLGVSDFSNSTYSALTPAGRSAFGPGGSYKLKVAFDNKDQNGTAAAATPGTLGTTTNLAIGGDPGVPMVGFDGKKDVDFYAYTAATAGFFSFTATGDAGFIPNLTLWKLNANGTINKYATTTKGSAQLIRPVAAGETILVSVTGSGNDNFDWFAPTGGGMTGTYSLTALLRPTTDGPTITNNQVPSAGAASIADGDVTLGNLGMDGIVVVGSTDVDLYSFTATTTQTLNIHLDLTADNSADTFLRFFNSGGDELKYTGDPDASNTHKDLRVQVTAGHTYYIGVNGNSLGARTYTPITGASATSAPNSMGNYVLSLFPIGPGPGIAQTTDQVTFNWAPVDATVSYQVLVVDLNTNTLVLNQTNITATSYTLTANQAFTPGHNFVWYVGAIGVNGVTTYSGPQNFSITAMAAPTQLGPIGNVVASTGYDLPTFTWTAVANAGRYHLYVVDAVTGVAVINRPNVIGTTYTATVTPAANELFTPGRSYRWYVLAFSTNNQAFNYALSGQTFTLAALTAPTLNGPTGTIPPAANYDMPTFTWNATAGVGYYRLFVVDVATNTAVIDKNVTTLSYPTPPEQALTPGRAYRWYVLAYSTNGQALNFDAAGRTFTLGSLPAPTLTGPSGAIAAAAGYDTPTFNWSAAPGAHQYRLYVYDQTTNTAVLDKMNSATTFSYMFPGGEGLPTGHSYIWYVLAYSTNGLAVNYVPGQSFSLAALPSPTLISPIGLGAQDLPTFNWTSVPAATKYAFFLFDLSLNQSPTGVLLSTPNSLTLGTPLIHGRTYRWWVASVSANGMYTFVANQQEFTVTP